MLSQLLVAFTIEHDNEWERRFWLNAHPRPVRTSLVMWANFLRFVRPGGTAVFDLSAKAGYATGKVHPDLPGMLRWGYVVIDAVNPKKPKANDVVRPTSSGLEAAETWQPLAGEIERRWAARFGIENVARLRDALVAIIAAFQRPLPHYFPVLEHRNGMRVPIPHVPDCDPPAALALPYLLSQAHHLYTLYGEQISEISLAIRSNVLRVVDGKPVAISALPPLSGIAKEALSMSFTCLKKKGLLVEVPSLSGRGKSVRLTPKGEAEKERYPEILKSVESAWLEVVSAEQIANLRSALLPFVHIQTGQESPLFQGLTPPAPELWRSTRRKKVVLPYHPMVLSRGGWPDGS